MIVTPLLSAAVNDRFDVVIVGGGFTGRALAVALATGLGPSARIAVIARESVTVADHATADSRATALSAASVRMLERMGVWALCRDAAQAVTAIDITDSATKAGVRPVLMSYDNALGSGETASYIVPNRTLDAALAKVADMQSRIIQFAGTAVTAFQAAMDTVTITLSDGRTIKARLLVAADGRRSGLRAMAGISTVTWAYPQTGITVTVRHDRPHNGRAVQHFLPGGPFAMLPLPNNRSCITWSEDTATARRLLALDDGAFLDELDQRAGGRLGALTLDGPRQSWPLEFSLARALVAPRFALVGDAAHNVHPIAGQGLNLGLRDVAALAEAVVDAHRLGLDVGSGPVLARYERWRRFDTWMSAAGFDMLNRVFSTEGTLRRAAREFGLGLLDRMPGIKQRLVAQAAGVAGDLPRLLRGEAI